MKNLYKELKKLYDETSSLVDEETKKYMAANYIATEVRNRQEYKLNWIWILSFIFAVLIIGLIFYLI